MPVTGHLYRQFRKMLMHDGGAALVEYALAMTFVAVPAFGLVMISLQIPPVAVNALGHGAYAANTSHMPNVPIPSKY